MPELPEVEDAARRLRAALVGRTIAQVEVLHASQRRTLSESTLARLAGERVVAVTRRAKLQLVELASGGTIEVHFRMNGDWDIARAADEPPPHERVRFTLDDGARVSLVDSRALCVVRFHEPGALALPTLGPEPSDPAFDTDALLLALARRRGPIKPVLLDQRVVAGLGNIYAAEALWEARIDPRAPADRVSRERIARLVDAIRTVLERAPAGRYYETDTGTSNADDEAWRVYGREGAPCRRCDSTIRRITQAGRSTFYCGRCQR